MFNRLALVPADAGMIPYRPNFSAFMLCLWHREARICLHPSLPLVYL